MAKIIRKKNPNKKPKLPCSNRRIMSIDPGVDGTGYAIWDDDDRGIPAAHGVLTTPKLFKGKKYSWGVRATDMAAQVSGLCSQWNVGTVWVEWPSDFEGARGNAAAKEGSVIKLAALTGMIWIMCIRHAFASVVPVDVTAWKGQLPKAAVIARIKRATGKAYKSHAADAVGIGLYMKGIEI